MILVIEGIDGCGKTSVVEGVSQKLAVLQDQLRVCEMAFPNRESPTGRVIDGYLRDLEHFKGMDAYVHQALQVVNRLEVYKELNRRDYLNVLSRYTPSGIVYGLEDDLPREWLNRVTEALPVPDLCVLLVTDPVVAHARVMCDRGATSDQYERRGVDWFTRVARRYDELWAEADRNDIVLPTTWARVTTAGKTLDQLAEQIAKGFLSMFNCPCGKIHNDRLTACHEGEDDDEE